MGVFVILLIVPILMQHIAIEGHLVDYRKQNNAALTFFFLLLTVLVMFRHESVGNDTRNYIYFFKAFCRIDWVHLDRQGLEIGYAYINKIISLFSKNPQVFLAVVSLLICVMIYPTYKRLNVDASLSIVIYSILSTFPMMFTGIRQMLSIGLGFIAYEFVRSKKWIPFLLVVCFAISCHASAFMLVFMYPLYHAKITRKWLLVVAPIILVIFVYNRPIFAFLTAVLESFTEYDGSITSTGAYTMLILFTIFTIFAFLIPDETVLDEETIGLRNFLLFALVIQMFAPLHTLAMRMNYYYIIFVPLLLPKIIEYRSRRWEQLAVLGRHVMVVFFLLYFFYNASTEGSLHVFPYHFFWESIG